MVLPYNPNRGQPKLKHILQTCAKKSSFHHKADSHTYIYTLFTRHPQRAENKRVAPYKAERQITYKLRALGAVKTASLNPVYTLYMRAPE